jgi:enterochelin esterase-like enzyme
VSINIYSGKVPLSRGLATLVSSSDAEQYPDHATKEEAYPLRLAKMLLPTVFTPYNASRVRDREPLVGQQLQRYRLGRIKAV